MICPRCRERLLLREREGRTCGKCGRPFALEPQDNPLRLHDIRVQTLADKLGDERGLRYTLPQLWYAASRKHVAVPEKQLIMFRFVFSFPGLIAFVLTLNFTRSLPIALAVGLGEVAVVNLALTLFKRGMLRAFAVEMPMSYDSFRDKLVDAWLTVYGRLPRGLVPAAAVLPPAPSHPEIAILCTDDAVSTCLAANAAAARAIVLVDRIERVPARIPVLILHDASVAGLLLTIRARTALGPRAAAVGIRPRTVLGQRNALRLRGEPPSEADLARVRAAVTEAEFAWLAEGWWSPLAAVRPAKLLAAVDGAARRAQEAVDPDRRRARETGFLTWPTH